jgi:hypothetical protein
MNAIVVCIALEMHGRPSIEALCGEEIFLLAVQCESLVSLIIRQPGGKRSTWTFSKPTLDGLIGIGGSLELTVRLSHREGRDLRVHLQKGSFT